MKKWIFDEPEKSLPRKAGEFALGLGTAAVKGGLENIVEAPSNFFQMSKQHANKHLEPITRHLSPESKKFLDIEQPPVKQYSEYVEPFIKSQFGEKSIEPENNFTRGLQSAARVAPAVALGGFNVGALRHAGTAFKVLKALPSAFFSSIPGAVAYESFGEESEDEGWGMKALRTGASVVANIAAKKGFNEIAKVFNKATNTNYLPTSTGPSKVEAGKTGLYNKRNELGHVNEAGEKVKRRGTKGFRNNLNDVIDKLATETDLTVAQEAEVRNKVNKIQNIVPGINEKPEKFIEAKEAINKLFEDWQEKPLYKQFGKLKKAIEHELTEIGKENPEWDRTRKAADEIHKIQKWKPNLVKIATKWTKAGKIYDILPNPIAYGALSTLIGATKGATYGLSAASPLLAKGAIETIRGGKFLWYLGQIPEGRKILAEITFDAAKGSEAALAKDLRAMNRLVPKYEKHEQQHKPKRWIVD